MKSYAEKVLKKTPFHKKFTIVIIRKYNVNERVIDKYILKKYNNGETSEKRFTIIFLKD